MAARIFELYESYFSYLRTYDKIRFFSMRLPIHDLNFYSPLPVASWEFWSISLVGSLWRPEEFLHLSIMMVLWDARIANMMITTNSQITPIILPHKLHWSSCKRRVPPESDRDWRCPLWQCTFRSTEIMAICLFSYFYFDQESLLLIF